MTKSVSEIREPGDSLSAAQDHPTPDQSGLVAESARPRVLHQHAAGASPMDAGFEYAKEFDKLDVAALERTSSK